MFRNVIVGVDHHEGGRDAVVLAKQLVSGTGRLTLAHVSAGDPYAYPGVSVEHAASLAPVRLQSDRRAGTSGRHRGRGGDGASCAYAHRPADRHRGACRMRKTV